MTSARLRVVGGLAIVVVLGGAWLVTTQSGDDLALPRVTRGSADKPAPAEPPPLTGPILEFDHDTLSFGDVSSQVGLDASAPELARQRVPGDVGSFVGGASVGDYDGDGVSDLFVTATGGSNRLYRGTAEGTYTDVSDTAGVADDAVAFGDGSGAGVWADVDGDDDLDLFVGGVGAQPDRLFINAGDGTFADESEQRGIADSGMANTDDILSGYATLGAAFADWDRDGDLDLVTTHWAPPAWDESAGYTSGAKANLCDIEWRPRPEPSPKEFQADTTRSRLFENDGSGRFSDVTVQMGVDLWKVSAFTPVFADYDDDGWPDLFIAGDFCTSRLYRNTTDGGFTDVTKESGLGLDENGMGSVVEDLNGDGILDWFITSIADGPDDVGCVDDQMSVGCTGNRLYLGRGDLTFVDATEQFGVRESSWAWGAAGDDLDNDGRRDLVAVNGYADGSTGGGSGEGRAPAEAAAVRFHATSAPRLWRGAPGGPWVEGAATVGLKRTGTSKALVAFDQDNDGDLDLLVANTGAAPQLFRNTADPARHWLGVRLHDGTAPNTGGVGAAVRIPKNDRGPGWMGEVRTGSGYQSSGPGSLHIGLGEIDDAEAIEVRWPDSDEFERYEVESVDITVEIERDS